VSRPELKGLTEVREQLATRFKNQHREWLGGGGAWPLVIGLAPPSESDALGALANTRAWAQEWGAWKGPGRVQLETRAWGKLGKHTVPVSISFNEPADVAALVGEDVRWARARRRYLESTSRWPALAQGLNRHFNELADYDDNEWRRLTDAVEWLLANRRSGLFPRQLPIRGLDTKWLEGRMTLVRSLLSQLVGGFEGDLYTDWGLRKVPGTCRVAVLDPQLRRAVGGVRDFAAPNAELAAVPWMPRRVLIVENLQSGLALPEMEDTVAILRRGYSLDLLGELPWLSTAQCTYWGDIDTHGFAMLALARKTLPSLKSVLMDEVTVERHKDLLVHEDDGAGAADPALLTAAEAECFRALVDGRWGSGARLEQERIPWGEVLGTLLGDPRLA